MAAIRSKRPVTPTFGTRSAEKAILTLNPLHFVKSDPDFCPNTRKALRIGAVSSVLAYFSGKNASSAFFSVGLLTSEPMIMSTSATVMPIVI